MLKLENMLVSCPFCWHHYRESGWGQLNPQDDLSSTNWDKLGDGGGVLANIMDSQFFQALDWCH